MIDTDTIKKYILDGEWEYQYPQAIEYLLAEVKRLRELFSIDEGSRDEGYCITMRLEGCEYIGTLRLYKDEEGKVIE